MNKVYIEYETADLISETEDGCYVVTFTKNNEVITKTINYKPIPFEEGGMFPKWIKHRARDYRFTGKIHSWKRDGVLQLFAVYLSNQPQDDKTLSLKEAMPLECEPPVFMTTVEISDRLDEINDKESPVLRQIKALQSELDEIRKLKIPVQDACLHDWSLINEESTGRNSLGTGFRRDFECSICGKETSRYHTTLG